LRRVLARHLQEEMHDVLFPVGDEAGMHLTVMLRTKHRDEEVAVRGVDDKLSLWPLSRMYLSRPRQGFVLGFGGVTAEGIPAGVRRLRALLDSK